MKPSIAALATISAITTAAVVTVSQAGATSSNIAAPARGTHYLIVDPNAPPSATVTGTATFDVTSVDLRCYTRIDHYVITANNVPVSSGAFGATISTSLLSPGTCILRAVPTSWSPSNSIASFTGPQVTTEWKISNSITSGPNAGRIYDYFILYGSAQALNAYASTTNGGLLDSRLLYSNGISSYSLWSSSASLGQNESGARSFLKVDGRNAYGPYSAFQIFPDNPGFPHLTFNTARNTTTGDTTIYEIDPIVVCPSETPFPPTAGSCPQFTSAGVRLERTIFTDDAGQQVHISDVWRSTDAKAHTISPHYDERLDGTSDTGQTGVGLKLPWLSAAYRPFTGDALFHGPLKVPASVFVRDEIAAPEENTDFPQGAITFDVAPNQIHRGQYNSFTLRDENIKVPASGTALVRQDFVIGTTQAEVTAKAAANAKQINPYRPDALIKTAAASAYLGNKIYNATGANQTATAQAKRGSNTAFDIEVQNDGTATDTFTLKGPGSVSGFAVRYLAGSTDITSAVTHGTYTLRNLAPRQERIIRLAVKVGAGATVGAIGSWLVATTSMHDGTRVDAVKASVKIVSRP